MKNLFLLLLICVINIGAWGQTLTGNPKKLIVKTEVDTLIYEIGMASSPSDGLLEFLQKNGCYDSTAINDYIKGFVETVKKTSTNKAYDLGKHHAMQIMNQLIPEISKQIYGEGATENINIDLFLAGFLDMIEGKSRLIVDGEPITQSLAYYELEHRIKAIVEKREAEEYLPNRLAGEAFLAKMAKEPGVMALEQGVLYKVIKTGANDGKHPTLDNTVKIAYKGSTIEGEVFDESEVSEFPLNQLIEGWQIALPKMTVGSKWTIYLPYEVAYGKRGSLPSIKPYSVLIFEIELLDILP